MSKKYLIEREGQLAFFEQFEILDTTLANYTDGVYGGTIFEFKKTIPNIQIVLSQAIKYLSHMRLKGESIPASILLVSLNQETAYLFKSIDYREEIEMVYGGAASKNNAKFSPRTEAETIHYDTQDGISRIKDILKDKSFIKIHLDVFSVVGWAERFYRENPTASKIMLFEELKEPKYFKDCILPPDKSYEHSWNGEESDFKFIMDLLNDKKHKKDLGAFYTPPPYCRKATELVRKAIARVPKGNEYIILDRCAGTGNLEDYLTDKEVSEITIGELDKYLAEEFVDQYLKDKKNVIAMLGTDNFNNITVGELEKYKTKIDLNNYIFDNELSHTIVSTYELKEWIVLEKRIGDKVKLIIPPPQEIDNTEALVTGGDALSSQFVKGQRSLHMTNEYSESINMIIDYVNDEKTNIILYENPPYSDVGAVQNNSATSTNRTAWKDSFVCNEMKKWMADNKAVSSRASNDLANLFIWSGFEYYLRKPEDSYILFSPPKYIKSHHLISKEMVEGYIFNRAHFHANASAISCIWWRNTNKESDDYELEVLDIENEKELVSHGNQVIKKVYKNLSSFYDKYDSSQYPDDEPGIIMEWNGTETERIHSKLKPIYNKNLVGYLVAQDFGFEHPRLATNLVRTLVYAEHGFYLRSENFLKKLPLFAAGKYDFGSRWWENGTIFKCSDGGERYLGDISFLKECLIFTCLSYFNKCRSFIGSDGRYYRNELCFDGNTLACSELEQYSLTPTEQELLEAFEKVLQKAKDTKRYNSKYAYGTFQIDFELNTFTYDEITNDKNYDYPKLNSALADLKTKLTEYYESIIQPKLFEYELLK